MFTLRKCLKKAIFWRFSGEAGLEMGGPTKKVSPTGRPDGKGVVIHEKGVVIVGKGVVINGQKIPHPPMGAVFQNCQDRTRKSDKFSHFRCSLNVFSHCTRSKIIVGLQVRMDTLSYEYKLPDSKALKVC